MGDLQAMCIRRSSMMGRVGCHLFGWSAVPDLQDGLVKHGPVSGRVLGLGRC